MENQISSVKKVVHVRVVVSVAPPKGYAISNALDPNQVLSVLWIIVIQQEILLFKVLSMDANK